MTDDAEPITQCVILAGGLATRMRPLTESIPKTLLEVAGRPFADHQLAWLASQGIESVVYCIGHLGDQVVEHVGDGRRFGVRIDYVDEGEDLMGTAGALRKADEQGVLDRDFFTLYGDSYLTVDLLAVASTYRRVGTGALMTVLPVSAVPGEQANALPAGDRVKAYDKRPSADAAAKLTHIDYGLGVFSRETIRALVPLGRVVDLADVQHQLANANRLTAYEVGERFHEIGSPDGLRSLNDLLSS